MSRRLAALLSALLSALLLALPSPAGEILSGRLYTVPDKIYANQAFEVHFELELTFGSEISDLRISGIPTSPDLLTLGQLETVSQNRVVRDGQALNVLHFSASARCRLPLEQTFEPSLLCMLSERRSSGFFSQIQSYQRQKRLEPFRLRVLALPEAGRPAAFSGAIGLFRLGGSLSENSASPGDIVTLRLELSGQGWLGDAAMPAPTASPLFKTYPPKQLLREPLRVRSEQVFIPASTNACEIPAVTFHFFNPATERYEACSAGPFRLAMSEKRAAPAAEALRVIDAAAPEATPARAQTVALEGVSLTLRQMLPLGVAAAGAFAAFFVFFLLYGRHRRLAFALGAALLAAGAGAGYALSGKAAAQTRLLARHTEVLFAPSRAAATLFALPAGAAVVPLETAGAWTRIDASERRGWIPSSALAE